MSHHFAQMAAAKWAKYAIPTQERFEAKFAKSEGCWFWSAAHFQDGYGSFLLNGRNVNAHRVAYELYIGPIPEGKEIDHLCRNRGCVRPDHLEPVERRTNILRGIGFGATNALKTHCLKGHRFDLFNTYQAPGQSSRDCRRCRQEREARRAPRARRALALLAQAIEKGE